MMWNFIEAMADFQELHDYSRKYPNLLTAEEIGKLDQRQFVRYCREQLWEKIAKEKFSKPFEELALFEKGDVDFDAILQIALAQEKVREEGD